MYGKREMLVKPTVFAWLIGHPVHSIELVFPEQLFFQLLQRLNTNETTNLQLRLSSDEMHLCDTPLL